VSPNCIDVERIADVETAPEGHPLRQHVAECPRCQSLWLSYQTFMKADVKDATHIDSARRALESTIRAQAVGAGARREAAPRTSRMGTRTTWPAWLRPAIVTAAAAVLTAVGVSIWRGGPETTVLRGGSESLWSLQEPQVSSSAIVFAWKAVPDADSYDVEIFDDALNQVLHSAAVTATTITVDRSALSSVPAGAALSWRVRALKAGDEVATSPPASLTLP
jgi:hypothetical protein